MDKIEHVAAGVSPVAVATLEHLEFGLAADFVEEARKMLRRLPDDEINTLWLMTHTDWMEGRKVHACIRVLMPLIDEESDLRRDIEKLPRLGPIVAPELYANGGGHCGDGGPKMNEKNVSASGASPVAAAIAAHRAAWQPFRMRQRMSTIGASFAEEDAMRALLRAVPETYDDVLQLKTHLDWWVVEEEQRREMEPEMFALHAAIAITAVSALEALAPEGT